MRVGDILIKETDCWTSIILILEVYKKGKINKVTVFDEKGKVDKDIDESIKFFYDTKTISHNGSLKSGMAEFMDKYYKGE